MTDATAPAASTADDHARRAAELFLDDRLDECRAELEAAFRAYRDARDPRRAARVAMSLAELHSAPLGNRAAAQGWLGRARRLLDGVGHCVEWGWLEVALLACDRPDVEELERATARALVIADEFGDRDLEVRALSDSGLALVSLGRTSEGIARLDEAMAAITAGEVQDPAVAGMSFCAMLSSCERAGDVRRAEEWMRIVTTQMLEPLGGRPRVLHTHCRLAYGSVLSSAGRWSEAEAALLDALGPNASRAVGHRVDATARLAELRVHQGRVEEAAELLAPHEHTLAACLPLAHVHLAHGRPDRTVTTAARGLRELVGDVTRRAPLLAVTVEAEIARNDVDAARRAARELAEIADRTQTPDLLALAALSAGRVQAASGDVDAATAAFEAARHHVAEDPRPLLAGTALLELAEVLAASGAKADAIDAAQRAHDELHALGAAARADRARALLRRLGAPAAGRAERPEARLAGLTRREAEVLALLPLGLSNAEIAGRLFISAKTAEHHVGRILTKLGVRTRAEAAAVAAAATLQSPERTRDRAP